MSIKLNLNTETVPAGQYAVAAPRRTDTIGSALCKAFHPPAQEQDFNILLKRIDQAARACRRD